LAALFLRAFFLRDFLAMRTSRGGSSQPENASRRRPRSRLRAAFVSKVDAYPVVLPPIRQSMIGYFRTGDRGAHG
jgi:hypothetical protein